MCAVAVRLQRLPGYGSAAGGAAPVAVDLAASLFPWAAFAVRTSADFLEVRAPSGAEESSEADLVTSMAPGDVQSFVVFSA